MSFPMAFRHNVGTAVGLCREMASTGVSPGGTFNAHCFYFYFLTFSFYGASVSPVERLAHIVSIYISHLFPFMFPNIQ
jgi:hypothetical protein